MRKKSVILILALSAVLFAAAACNKSQPQEPPVEVEFSLDYHFVESGSMTKSGEEIYSNFYEKYVKTKQLTPRTFTLKFKNVETGATSTFNGIWDKAHTVKMTTGEYEVTGESFPQMNYGHFNLDSLYICFDETVVITEATKSLNLTAKYDSWLLMFDKGDKDNIHYTINETYSDKSVDLKILDDVYYSFFNTLDISEDNTLKISRGKFVSEIKMNAIPFEKGKYYYFNDTSNSFDIPPMESGN